MIENAFYKDFETDKIWFVESSKRGQILFSFDKKKIYEFFKDYPQKLTEEEKIIFDEENPELAKLKKRER